ncbi:MAG TPA: hypothetical protein VM243_02980 [Phycisphaerae bacterium]|nr:hypothetical protein [Phycisphaerae bacterium]
MTDAEVAEAKPAKSKKMLAILVIGGLMLAEGALIFGAMTLFGGSPGGASAATNAAGAFTPSGEMSPGDVAEVLIAELDAFNSLSGRLQVYHLQVSALVHPGNRGEIESIVKDRAGTISDRINTVIRGADPKHLNEPGLETLRRQIKFELDKVFGNDSLVLELLVPQLLQTRGGL